MTERDPILKDVLYRHAEVGIRPDVMAGRLPGFVTRTRERPAEGLVLRAERKTIQKAIQEKAQAGTIPEEVAEVMLDEIARELAELRSGRADELRHRLRERLRRVRTASRCALQELSRSDVDEVRRAVPAIRETLWRPTGRVAGSIADIGVRALRRRVGVARLQGA